MPNSYSSQKGAALLILLMLIVVTGSTLALSVGNNNRDPFLQQEKQTREEAFRAKQALLTYAMQYVDFFADDDASDDNEGPGRLPCPDLSNSGNPGDCSSLFGRLPQIDTPASSPFQFNDEFIGIDRQYWYAVSSNFNPLSNTVNTNTAASLSVDGDSSYVAVLIAPGEAVAGQARPSNDPEDYLEGGNEGGLAFVNSYAGDPDNFNDRVLGIMQNELMTFTTIKVAAAIREVLHDYHLGSEGSPVDLTDIVGTLLGDDIEDLLEATLGPFLAPILAPLLQGPAISGTLTALGISADPAAYPDNNNFPPSVAINLAFIGNLNVPLPLLNGVNEFTLVMDDQAPDWYFDDGWDALTEATYDRDPNNDGSTSTATFRFAPCAIIFTVEYNDMATPADSSDDVSELSWTPNSC